MEQSEQPKAALLEPIKPVERKARSMKNAKFRHSKLTISIPVFNEERFIGDCLASLEAQTNKDFMVLISDNCSVDASKSIAEEFSRRNVNFHTVSHDRNMGAAANFQFLLENSESPLFQWLGAHDALSENYVETMLEVHAHNPDCSLAYTKTQWINEAGQPLKVTLGGSENKIVHADNVERYLMTISANWPEYTAVNGVFKRRALSGVFFKSFPGADHLVISYSAFYGDFKNVPSAMYLRRDLGPRTQKSVNKLTPRGRKQFRRDTRVPLASAYVGQFLNLPASRMRKLQKLPRFLFLLSKRYEPFKREFARLGRWLGRNWRRTGMLSQ